MSNALSIATVTAALQNLIIRALQGDSPDVRVTTKPPDRARTGDGPNQVNLFLYQAHHNAALRNMEVPRRSRPGETAPPPLALDLRYLLTVYAQNDDGADSQKLLGRSMLALHDHAVLGAKELQEALPGNDLHQQIERVRITPEPLTLEEMSKLWTTFQTQYRLSAVYQVSAVLIESKRPPRMPLPVLAVGLRTQADLAPPYPHLDAAVPPNRQVGVRLGETLTLAGAHLEGDSVEAQFMTRLWARPITVPARGGSAAEVAVTIPVGGSDWPAGSYTVAAVIHRGARSWLTNALPFSLSPRIDSIAPPAPQRDKNGQINFNLLCAPQVWADQRASLLFDDREVPLPPRSGSSGTLQITLADAPAGDHYLRLRVDGVDSELIKRAVSPPVFDDTQKVTVR